MRKFINTLGFILFLGAIAVSLQRCNGATGHHSANAKIASSDNHESSQVKAYYFHGTRRCATCMAVESVSKEAIKEYYGDKVIFKSINGEEERGNPLLTKYKVTGTTLLIVKGDKTVDITNDAFLNARTHPNKLKSKLKSTIDSMK